MDVTATRHSPAEKSSRSLCSLWSPSSLAERSGSSTAWSHPSFQFQSSLVPLVGPIFQQHKDQSSRLWAVPFTDFSFQVYLPFLLLHWYKISPQHTHTHYTFTHTNAHTFPYLVKSCLYNPDSEVASQRNVLPRIQQNAFFPSYTIMILNIVLSGF